MKDRICIYEKFGFCRNSASCKFYHPTLVCDDQNCDIKECSKRHPQACRFFTSLNHCKFGDSCKFLHRKKPEDTVRKEEYDTLKEKYDLLIRNYNNIEENYSKIQNRVASLESNMFNLMRNEIHNIQRDANLIGEEGHGEKNEDASENVKRKADVGDDDDTSSKLYDKKSRFTGFETPVSNDNNENDAMEFSYHLEEDDVYHEVLKYEYKFSAETLLEVGVLRSDLMTKNIEETVNKLNILKEKVKKKRNEMRNNSYWQLRHPTSEIESEDTYKMVENVIKMVEYLEKLPKNKFRKIAAKDLETIYIEINEVRNKKVKMINTLKINCED